MAVLKYIVMAGSYRGHMYRIPVLFNARLPHDKMMLATNRVLNDETRAVWRPDGAGFLKVDIGTPFDRSETLDMGPDKLDLATLQDCGQYDYWKDRVEW